MAHRLMKSERMTGWIVEQGLLVANEQDSRICSMLRNLARSIVIYCYSDTLA